MDNTIKFKEFQVKTPELMTKSPFTAKQAGKSRKSGENRPLDKFRETGKVKNQPIIYSPKTGAVQKTEKVVKTPVLNPIDDPHSMIDPRIAKLAKSLVNYSAEVKKGDNALIWADPGSVQLSRAIWLEVIKQGANPMLLTGSNPQLEHDLLAYGNEKQIKNVFNYEMVSSKESQSIFYLNSEQDPHLMDDVPPERIALRSKAREEIIDYRTNHLHWVLTQCTNHNYAAKAGMAYEDFEKFYYNAMNQDWNQQNAIQDRIKERIDNAKQVHLVGKNTDLTFSVEGRKAEKCVGKVNVPDGEVFCAPVRETMNGHVQFSFPAVTAGGAIPDVYLEYKAGELVKYTCSGGPEMQKKLDQLIHTDEGAKYFGEFGIGTNFGIDKFTNTILFDEKMGGTVHLALGDPYEGTGGTHTSSIHQDIVTDLREGGEIWLDGILFQKNGQFLLEDRSWKKLPRDRFQEIPAAKENPESPASSNEEKIQATKAVNPIDDPDSVLDPKVVEFAKILVDYSSEVKPGENVMIFADPAAAPLSRAVWLEVIKRGGNPLLVENNAQMEHDVLKYGTDEQAKHMFKSLLDAHKECQTYIALRSPEDSHLMDDVAPERVAMHEKANGEIMHHRLNKMNWVVTRFPTRDMAAQANMSYDEYCKFFYNAVIQDWSKQNEIQDKIKSIVDNAKEVHLTHGPKDNRDIDLTFSIKDRKAEKCVGKINVPDGEVYCAPDIKTVNGHVKFSWPAVTPAGAIPDVYLEYKDGELVKYTCSGGPEMQKKLDHLIHTDEGAKYFGEFGIGTNFEIDKFTNSILFDEKIGGSIHLALGNPYEGTGGTHHSDIHQDIVTDLRDGGEIQLDGKVFQKDGKFHFENFEGEKSKT